MTKDEKKIHELELEVARLKGVIEGLKADPYRLYPRPYPYPVVTPYPQPFWYQTYCGGGSTAQFTATPNTSIAYSEGTSTTANFGPTTISGMN